MSLSYSQTNWGNGDTPDEADLDKWEQGIADCVARINAIRESAAHAYVNAAGVTLTSGADTKLTLDTEEFDLGNEFDNATNYRFTATNTGTYLIIGSAYVYKSSPAAGENVRLLLYKNNSLYKRIAWHEIAAAPGASYDFIIQGSIIVRLTAGDYIDLRCYVSATGWTAYTSGTGDSYLSIARIG